MVCFLEQELRTGSGLISDDRVKGKIPIFVVNSSRSSCLTHCLKCHKIRQIILYTFPNQSAFGSEVIPYFFSQNVLGFFFWKLKSRIGLLLFNEILFLIEITKFLLIVDLVSSAFLYSRFRLPETATWTNIWLQFFFRDLGFNCNIFDLSSITFYSICSRYKTFDLWRKSQALT